MWRNGWMSLASITSVAASLIILGLVFSLILNINSMGSLARDQFDTVVAYLSEDSDVAMSKRLMGEIEVLPGVRMVTYVSQEDALRKLKSDWGENAYLLEGLETNPLPTSFDIILTDISYASQVVEQLKMFDGIDTVKSYEDIVNHLLSFTEMLKRVGSIIIFILIGVSTFIIHNAIRITVITRTNEIRIMKYVGATNWFVRWPFLIEGVLLGAIGASLALVAVRYGYQYFYGLMQVKFFALLTPYVVTPIFIVEEMTFLFFIIGGSIGALGSVLSMRKNLKV